MGGLKVHIKKKSQKTLTLKEDCKENAYHLEEFLIREYLGYSKFPLLFAEAQRRKNKTKLAT